MPDVALGRMADVMPNVADGIATVVYYVLHEFCYIYGWHVKQSLCHMIDHLEMNV